MKKRFFITATGTEIGKTFVTAGLVAQAKALGKSVIACKPFLTGFDRAQIENSDTGVLLKSMGLPPTMDAVERITPWRYAAPLAPSMAARLENRSISFDEVVAWSRKIIDGPEDIVMIEGIGGAMVPIDEERHTVMDWHEALGIPALLVTGSYLGTISHTLTALAVMEYRKIPVARIVLNESENSSVSLEATADEFRRLTKIHVTAIKRRATQDGWRDVKELQEILS